MKWVPYPSKTYSDPRLEAAGEAAEILWSRAWAWIGDQETDGFIPEAMVARLCPTRTRARLAALLEHDIWVAVDGGYKPTDWDETTGDVRGLERVREQAAERARRYRKNRANARATLTASSRDASRDDHALEEKERDTPQPPAERGATCDPISQPHRNCRGCHTSRRSAMPTAAEAAAAEAAAIEQLRARRAAVPHCGACDPHDRTVEIEGVGWRRCSGCHPDLVVGPLPRPQLAVVPQRAAHR